MQLHKLKTTNRKKSSRVGRGISAGKGKTCGRGTKGQKSRTGHNIPKRFEGGQTPFTQRMPKTRGFKSLNAKVINIDLNLLENNFCENEKVTPRTLYKKGLIDNKNVRVKILFRGKLTKKLHFSGILMSQSAKKSLVK